MMWKAHVQALGLSSHSIAITSSIINSSFNPLKNKMVLTFLCLSTYIIMHSMDMNTTKYATLIDAANGRSVSLSGSIVNLFGFHREYYDKMI